MQDRQYVHSLARYLKKHYPRKKVSVRLVKSFKTSCTGTITFHNGLWTIRIRCGVDLQTAIDALLHEFAHVVSDIRSEPHDENFGVRYAEIYRHYEDWLEAEGLH